MDRIHVDYSELAELHDLMKGIPRGFMPKVQKITSKGALNIKRGWAQRWRRHRSIRHLPRAINYDIDRIGPIVHAEIGPDRKRRQGNLAHIIEFGNTEYGTVHNAPIPAGKPALDDEAPRFAKALADFAEKAAVERDPEPR